MNARDTVNRLLEKGVGVCGFSTVTVGTSVEMVRTAAKIT